MVVMVKDSVWSWSRIGKEEVQKERGLDEIDAECWHGGGSARLRRE